MATATAPAESQPASLDYNEKVALGLAAAFGSGLGLVTWAFNRESRLSRQAKSHLHRVSLYTLGGIGTTWGTRSSASLALIEPQQRLT